MAEVEFIGATELRAALLAITENEERVTRKAVREMALRLTNYAKREASGPARTGGPRVNRKGQRLSYRAGGPGVVTGTLRRSILPFREGRLGAYSWYSDVAPRTPYARRLELGFFGTDSLGRRYNQPPYRYMRPAYIRVRDQADRIMARAWKDGLTPG